MSLLDDFLVRAALAGLGVALAAAPLGCFVVWRRMAYFGDATAHAAILGVALALALHLPILGGVLVTCLAMAAIVTGLSGRTHGSDTLLGVAAHSALAVGLVAVSLIGGVRIDLSAYLFGDILAVGRMDLAVIWTGAVAVNLLIWARWSRLLTATLSPDLARASDIDPRREEWLLTLGLALIVAVAIKVVGALLIAAFLLIPPATARPLAGTPERMALLAAGLGAVATLAGLRLSWIGDTPAGPTIVATAAGLFLLTTLIARAQRARQRR